MNRGSRAILALVLVLVPSAIACNKADRATDDAAHDHAGDSHDERHLFPFGAPGDEALASRTIEVSAAARAFDPPTITVKPGETVVFEVTNEGGEPHEFVLGDAAYQEKHAEAMSQGMHHDDGNVLTLAPGDTKALAWTFGLEGEVIYGCHVAGHYEAGMFGEIEVAA